jgi:REP element-mobilizing transposase RayT
MWNDTDTPLAYLITFRTYGTWLHGDERGSVNRFRNIYGTKSLPHVLDWQTRNSKKLKIEPVQLNDRQRTCVRMAITACCNLRGWNLMAVNIRTNHVHAVVNIGEKRSSIALNALKANATRELRRTDLWTKETSPWSERGSMRCLWNEKSVSRAIDYVTFGQGGDLPTSFDWLD